MIDQIHKQIPKEILKNLEWRKQVVLAAPKMQSVLTGIFSQFGEDSLVVWINSCAWTVHPKDITKPVYQPFILWKRQEEIIRELYQSIIDGYDVCVPKSRETGCTWLSLYVILWFWLYKPGFLGLVCSRNANLVDVTNSPDCLFAKLDFALHKLPAWMRPDFERTSMHIKNVTNGSVISGESTTGDIARGGRQSVIMLDEFAAMETGEQVIQSTSDATKCRWFISTPKGRENAFGKIRFSGKVKVVEIHWKDDPDKGKDAKLITKENGEVIWISSWYEQECARRTSALDIAENLDISFVSTGSQFFDSPVIESIRRLYVEEPKHIGDLEYEVETIAAMEHYKIKNIKFKEGLSRHLSWFEPLIDGRPNQKANYIGFADISLGTGASNSAIVICKILDVLEQVGTFASPTLPPHEFAHYTAALVQWIGGQRPLYLGFEDNGGFATNYYRQLLMDGVDNLYYRKHYDEKFPQESKKAGWFSSRSNKMNLLSDLRASLAKKEYKIRDGLILDECLSYIRTSNGAIEASEVADKDSGAKFAHADRVIAAAGCVLLFTSQLDYVEPAKPIVPNSAEERINERQRQKKALTGWD